MKMIADIKEGLIAFAMAVALFSCDLVSVPDTKLHLNAKGDIYADVEFDMPKVVLPVFPENDCIITDFGAVSDGVTNNTQAFADAIEDISKRGGGRVIVPRGIWLTGPIELRSNINLHVEDGAIIVFSKDFDEYPIIKTIFEGLDTYRCISPIYGKDLEHVAITGKGIIDGSGDAWRPVKKEKLTERHWKALIKSGGVVSDDGKIWYPTEKSKNGDSRDNFNVPDFTDPGQFEDVKDYLRPVMVSLVSCKKVLLDGPTFQNSPAWNIHPLMCEDLTIRNLTVRNPWYSQNGDGLDLESCKNVVVYNNSFDVGDDAICIKSGKNEDGRERGIPTENVIITNNIVYHGHGGFTIGSEMSGGVRNMHISNCTFIGTDIGLRFKSTRGRGGVVEDIYISNIDMINIPAEAIRFNLFYGGQSPIPDSDQHSETTAEIESVPVTEETPAFRRIFMTDIHAMNCGAAAYFQGLPEMMLEDIHLKNASFSTTRGITIIDAKNFEFENVKIDQKQETVMDIYNGVALSFEKIEDTSHGIVKISGAASGEISFIDSNIGDHHIQCSEDLNPETFKIVTGL
jgi:polygalacturonase